MIKIIEVKTKKELKAFVDFQNDLYKGCLQYIPPFYSDEMNNLHPTKNPSYGDCKTKYFLALKDNVIVGRIAGIICFEENQKDTGKTFLRFSRYDAIDDMEVATALFDAIKEFAKTEKLTHIHGPMGFNDFDREGLVVEGFECVTTSLNTYNYEYYKRHIEAQGFIKEADWLEYKIYTPEKMDERILRLSAHIKEKYELKEVAHNYKIGKMIDLYGHKIFDLLNDTYAHLHGFVEIKPKVRDGLIGMFKIAVDPKYVSIVLDKDDNLVGFGLAIPQIGEGLKACGGKMFPLGFLKILKAMKSTKVIELMLIAVSKPYRNCGVNAIIMERIMQSAIDNNIVYAETNPELENNKAVQSQWRLLNKVHHRRRRCYIASVSGDNSDIFVENESVTVNSVSDLKIPQDILRILKGETDGDVVEKVENRKIGVNDNKNTEKESVKAVEGKDDKFV